MFKVIAHLCDPIAKAQKVSIDISVQLSSMLICLQ